MISQSLCLLFGELNDRYSTYGYLAFLIPVCWIAISNYEIFTKRFARSHRLMGAFHLIWLCVGFYDAFFVSLLPFRYEFSVLPHVIWLLRLDHLWATTDPQHIAWIAYDIVLGVSGTVLTVTAAADFRYSGQRCGIYTCISVQDVQYFGALALVCEDVLQVWG